MVALLGVLAVGIISFLIGLAWGQQMQNHDASESDVFLPRNTPSFHKGSASAPLLPLTQEPEQPVLFPQPTEWADYLLPKPPTNRDLIEQELDYVLSLYQQGKLSEEDYLAQADALIDQLADAIRPA
ncbi:hypothetical protein [Nibrella saemangeumensis]